MTVLEALGILENAILECKQRRINTPEVKEALDLLEPHILPPSLISQFRHEALAPPTPSFFPKSPHEALPPPSQKPFGHDSQQQVLQATFPGIRDAVRILLRR